MLLASDASGLKLQPGSIIPYTHHSVFAATVGENQMGNPALISWWYVAAFLAGLAACALLAKSVRGLRQRRERHCPTCGYSLHGLPGLTCPECGCEAPSESSLWQRPRWKASMLWGVVLLLAACGLVAAPDWRLAVRLLPFDYVASIAFKPFQSDEFSAACTSEMDRRLNERGLTEDQYVKVIECLWNNEALDEFTQSAAVDTDGRVRMRGGFTYFSARLPLDTEYGVAAWITLSNKLRRFVPKLVERMHRPGVENFWDWSRLAVLARSLPEAADAVVTELACPQLNDRLLAKEAILIHIGPSSAPAVAAFLKSDDPRVREDAATILHEFGARAAPVLPELLEAMDCPEGSVSLDAKATILAIAPPPEALLPHVASILSSSFHHSTYLHGDGRREDARSTTKDLMNLLGPAAIPELVRNLGHDDLRVRAAAAEYLGDLGSVAQSALPALEKLAVAVDRGNRNPDRESARAAIRKIKAD